MNKHLEGLAEFHARQRHRIKKRIAAMERRDKRREVGVTDDTEQIMVTELSDDLGSFSWSYLK